MAGLTSVPGITSQVSFQAEKTGQAEHFWPALIPEGEKAFTTEPSPGIRHFAFPGKTFPKPVVITATNEGELPEMFKGVSRHMALAKKNDVAGILALFDAEDLQKVKAAFTPAQLEQAAAGFSKLTAYEVDLMVCDGPYLFAYGTEIRGTDRHPTVIQIKFTDGHFHPSGGLASVSTRWSQLLALTLKDKGLGAFHESPLSP